MLYAYVKYAEKTMSNIMNELLGGTVDFFNETDIECKENSEFTDGIDRWLVFDVLSSASHAYRKYPKRVKWGSHVSGELSPVDWNVRHKP